MTKSDWVMKFRRAKTLDTLEVMLNRAQSTPKLTTAQFAEVIRAHCHRESEIVSGKLIDLQDNKYFHKV